jgi:hypothetical protein
MGPAVIWAFLTGAISAGAWAVIVAAQREKRLADRYAAMLDRVEDQLAEMQDAIHRVIAVEDRMEYTERLLVQEREARKLPPAGA